MSEQQTTTDTPLVALIGEVAHREYLAARDVEKPRLEVWARTLAAMDDAELVVEAGAAIHCSALCQRFRGNFAHEHCKASACWYESNRRRVAAGHSDSCRGSTAYDRAFRNAWLSQGHSPDAYQLRDCDCGVSAPSETTYDQQRSH